MKKVWFAVLTAACLISSVVGLSACKKGGDGHTFSDEWTKSETGHWHACTAHSDCGEITGMAQHVWGQGEKSNECIVCHYVKHVHEMVWEFDETNHRHVSTCEDHEEVVEDEGPHSYTEGVCVCGVKKIQADSYPVYEAYTAATGSEPSSFADWVNMLNTEGYELTASAAGDVTASKTGGSEVYYAARTVTVSATAEGSPLSGVWFKVIATKGETSVLVGKAATGSNGVATISFIPRGYSADGYAYTVQLALQADLDRGLPYPADHAPVSNEPLPITVTDESATIEPAGSVSFERVLINGYTMENAEFGGENDESGNIKRTWFKLGESITEGYYTFELSNAEGLGATPAYYFYVGDESQAAEYAPRVLDAGAVDEAKGHYISVVYIPEGTTQVGIKCGVAYSPRHGDLKLTSLNELSAGENAVIVSGKSAKKIEYPCTLPAGSYKISATVYSVEILRNYSSGSSNAYVIGYEERHDVELNVGSTSYTLSADGAIVSIGEDTESLSFTHSVDLTTVSDKRSKPHYYYAKINIEAFDAVFTGEEFSIDFSEGSTQYRSFIPAEDGLYSFRAYADAPFSGLTVKNGSSTVLSTTASAASHSALFSGVAKKPIAFTFTGSGSVKFKIEKTVDETLTEGTGTDVTLNAERIVNYAFTPAKTGYYTLLISSENSLEGLTVTAGSVHVTAKAGEKFLVAVLNATEARKISITLDSNGAAVAATVKIATMDATEITETGIDGSFTATERVAYFIVKSTSASGEGIRVLLTGENLGNYKVYETNGTSKTAAATLDYNGVTSSGTLLIFVYTGDAASASLNVKKMGSLSAFTMKIEDGSVIWNKVNHATNYEVWLGVDDAAATKLTDISATDAASYTYDIPVQYYAAGTYHWKVVATAEGYVDSAEESEKVQTSQMVLVKVNVTIPAGYPKGTLDVGLIIMDNLALEKKTIIIPDANGLSTTLRFYGAESNYSDLTVGSANNTLNEKYSETPQSISFEEHVATVSYEPVKKLETTVTVKIKIPEIKEGLLEFSSLNLAIKEEGGESIKTKSYNAADLKGKTELTWEETITKTGKFSVEASSIAPGFTMANGSFTVSEVGAPASVSLTVKQNEYTLTFNLPSDYDGGNFTVDVYAAGVEKATQTVLATTVDNKTATATVVGLKNNASYTLKLHGWKRPYKYVAEDATYTVSEDFSVSGTAVIADNQGVEVVVNVYGFATGATMGATVYKANDLGLENVIDTATIEVAANAKTALLTIYVPEDGEYVVKTDAYTMDKHESTYYKEKFFSAYDAGSFTITVKSGETENTITLPIASTHVTVNVTVADNGLDGQKVKFKLYQASSSLIQFEVEITDAKATIYIFCLKDDFWDYGLEAIADDVLEGYTPGAKISIPHSDPSATYEYAIEKGGSDSGPTIEGPTLKINITIKGFTFEPFLDVTVTIALYDGDKKVSTDGVFNVKDGAQSISVTVSSECQGKDKDSLTLKIEKTSCAGIGGGDITAQCKAAIDNINWNTVMSMGYAMLDCTFSGPGAN